MTRNDLGVLLALSETETHGYGILKRMRGSGRPSLSASTLYSVIERLERRGLIEESDWRPEDRALDDERRRYYRLTARGLAERDAEIERLETLLRTARRVRTDTGR